MKTTPSAVLLFVTLSPLATLTAALPAAANDTPPYTATNRDGTQGAPNQAIEVKQGMTDTVSNGPGTDGRAKAELAPHSLLVQTELQSAHDQAEGMKMQLQAMDKPDPEVVDHLKIYRREVSSELSLAAEHQQHLQEHAKNFPQVMKSEPYRALNTDLDELKQLDQNWLKTASSKSYWQNKDQAKKDIDQLESKIDSALKKSKALNKDTLNISSAS